MVPSICYETFGIIILEAYRQKTPVIVRALGGLQEVVEESQGGFAYRTEEELCAAMERLRTDQALRHELGERGHRRYLERWTEEVHVELYLKMLREAAQKKFGHVPWELTQRANLAFRAGTEQR
jgi:glycosyltransferase involved in cell wall biosynthesis